MTVPSETSAVNYTGNGATTVFPTVFRFINNADVVVKVTVPGGAEVIYSEGIHYTLTGATQEAGGSVTFASAPANGVAITIERDVPFTQETSLRTQGSFAPGVHEDCFDYSVFRDQELRRDIIALQAQGAAGSVVAGSGLYFSGTTLHVGAGEGTTVLADTVAVTYGAAGAMTPVSKAAANAGSASSAARIDHKHDVLTATPIPVTKSSASEGSATTLSRSDHKHDVSTSAAAANPLGAANSEGSATTLARSDHTHATTAGVPVEISDSTLTAGVSVNYAAADHVHSHGVRGGGTLHALVTGTSVAFPAGLNFPYAHGFMSWREKQKALLTQTSDTGFAVDDDDNHPLYTTLTTSNATPTLLAIVPPYEPTKNGVRIPLGDYALGLCLEIIVTAKQSNGSGFLTWGRAYSFRRDVGGPLQSQSMTELWKHGTVDSWIWTATPYELSTTNYGLQLVVVGSVGSTIRWSYTVRKRGVVIA